MAAYRKAHFIRLAKHLSIMRSMVDCHWSRTLWPISSLGGYDISKENDDEEEEEDDDDNEDTEDKPVSKFF